MVQLEPPSFQLSSCSKPPLRAGTGGYIRRAKTHSVGSSGSGGIGYLVYSTPGYSRNGFCQAYRPVKRARPPINKAPARRRWISWNTELLIRIAFGIQSPRDIRGRAVRDMKWGPRNSTAKRLISERTCTQCQRTFVGQ